jgi:hypothetical protein
MKNETIIGNDFVTEFLGINAAALKTLRAEGRIRYFLDERGHAAYHFGDVLAIKAARDERRRARAGRTANLIEKNFTKTRNEQ